MLEACAAQLCKQQVIYGNVEMSDLLIKDTAMSIKPVTCDKAKHAMLHCIQGF
jgi:hypothetical protein